MASNRSKATAFAILAALLYAISSPLSKLLLAQVSATMMAALLYLGAGAGMLLVSLGRRAAGRGEQELPLTRKELPFTVGMVVLDIAAPIFLMTGLTTASAANVSLLNNFEIVATSVIALLVFHEKISRRLWLAIGLVTVASLMLSFEDVSSLDFSVGSVFVLLACVCWGFENNCTRMLSSKNPMEVVVIKGFGSGFGSLVIALAGGERLPAVSCILGALALGFVAYGLSILTYIYAQRDLGAAKTSAYYALSPFIGAFLSLIIFRQIPGIVFLAALMIMAAGAYFASTDGEGL